MPAKCLSQHNLMYPIFYLIYQDFKNELSILQSLDHPNIIKVKEVFLQDKQIWLITDLVEGGTLKDYIEKLTEITQFDVYIIMKVLQFY